MKLIDSSINRKVTVTMVTVAIIVFGMVSYSRLKLNLLPELTYPSLTVRTDYEGAAPQEVENLISKPLEEALGITKNLKSITSVSSAGRSDVILQFHWGTDMDYASLDVREKSDTVNLPDGVKKPTILRFDPSFEPVMRLAFYSKDSTKTENFNEKKLKYLRTLAEDEIKNDLEIAEGVAAVKVSGGLEEEISVTVDTERLVNLGIPIDQISNILFSENINMAGGQLEEGTHRFLVRTVNQFKTMDEIENVIISEKDGRKVYLKDIANVKWSYKDRESVTRLNGDEAVEIAIYKEGDANSVKVSEKISKTINRLKDKLPNNVGIEIFYDQSIFIKNAIDEVISAGIIGGILAVIILFLFLKNFWATVIISLSIPVSVIAAFNLMYSNDVSLNIMSLGGLTLGIGMLLDNSIVVLENITRHREAGKGIREAARLGASEVGMAVTASTLTTVAVFFPLVFVEGIAGQLFKDQALTVTFSLIASLIVALTLIPMLASLSKEKTDEEEVYENPVKERRTRFGKAFSFMFATVPVAILRGFTYAVKGISYLLGLILKPLLKGFDLFYGVIAKIYPSILKVSLNNRGLVIIISIALFALSLHIGKGLGVELIPQLTQGEFSAEFKYPAGTFIEKTDKLAASIGEKTSKLDNVAMTFSSSGTGNKLDASADDGGENTGEVSVKMKAGSRSIDEDVVKEKMREMFAFVPGASYKFTKPTLFSFKTPIEIEITGYNLDQLDRICREVAEKMENTSQFVDVKTTLGEKNPEVRIKFDREKASHFGIDPYKASQLIVNKIKGKVATKFSKLDKKVDILVKAQESDIKSLEDVRSLPLITDNGNTIRLSTIADVTLDYAPAEIRRINQQRTAIVSASLGYGDLSKASQKIDNILSTIKIPEGIGTEISGQKEEMDESFKSLRFVLLFAIFLVYLVMASQFESFIHPFVIIFTIPLAFIGAVFALWITGATVSVVVFIGAILLAGIVVNNAIVLIDLINQLRRSGTERMEAIVTGGTLRLRSILMTAMTTILGLIPLAMGLGEGAELRAPMAVTVIGGLLVSTILTLVVIPVVYSIFDRKKVLR